MTKDVISLSISVLLLFRHYISHKITFGDPSSGGVLCSACGAFITIVYQIFPVFSPGRDQLLGWTGQKNISPGISPGISPLYYFWVPGLDSSI